MRRLLSLLALGLAAALLCGFTPFTKVRNVCPQCPSPKTDVLILTNGFRVEGTVVAQNDAYYVVERYGEYRPVKKTEVTSVEWKDKGGAANLGIGDQVLLKDGVVLHGAILEEVKGKYFVIQVGSFKHTVWVNQISSVHKGGTPYTFSQS